MLYAIVAVIALILDQCMKVWTVSNIVVDTGEAKLIPGLVHFANVHNSGAAFSFLEGARWFFVVVCIIFVLVVIYALAKDLITHPVCRWSAVFVLAGALGNCIDRIFCGYVVDMFEFDFLIFKRPFPVFNVADIYITVGVIVFCIALLLEKPAASSQKKSTSAPASDAAAVPAESAAVPAAERKPLVRRHKKIEIPTFPKHELPDLPVMDPNDPFAEWEKRAGGSVPASEAAPSSSVVYTQPAAAKPAEPAAPVRPAAPAAEQAPAAPAAPSSAAQSAASKADEFDLDSILAEFKDL